MGFEDWKDWDMQLKSLKPITFSFIVSLGIAFVFLMATFYILAYSEPDAMGDAFSTTGSYFGAVATLGAAVIAAYLFNDWRVIKQYEIKLDYVLTIKKQTKELISFINSNRRNFIKYKFKIKSPNLTMQDFNVLLNEIHEIENEVVLRLNLISLEINELYFLETKKPQDPITAELAEKIKYFEKIGVNGNNYDDVWEKRLTTLVLDEYFQYITDDLTSFVYDKVMTRHLDYLILDAD